MKRQDRRRAEGDRGLSDASRTEEQRLESAKQPIAWRLGSARACEHDAGDELLLEQEILGDDCPHATGSTQLRGQDGQVKQG